MTDGLPLFRDHRGAPATGWMERAACRTRPDLPWTDTANASDAQVAAALRVCEGCPVRGECRDDMLWWGDRHGIRAGVLWSEGKAKPGRGQRGPLFVGTWVCRWCSTVFDRAVARRLLYCSPECADASHRSKKAGV